MSARNDACMERSIRLSLIPNYYVELGWTVHRLLWVLVGVARPTVYRLISERWGLWSRHRRYGDVSRALYEQSNQTF